MRNFQEVKLHKDNIGNVTWYTQAGTFTTKEKVELKRLKLPQLIQSRKVSSILTLLRNLMVTDMNSYQVGMYRNS